MSKTTRKTEGLSQIEKRLIETAVTLQQQEAPEIVFQHGIMCQVGLPRRKVETRVFERKFKNASILIKAGELWDGKKWVEQPLPFGAKPRIALCYIHSEALKNKNPNIDIGNSYNEFMERLGLSKGSAFKSLKEQMKALAACQMSFGFTHDGRATTQNMQPITRFDAWINTDERQTSLWPAELQLSKEYYESLLAHAVPLPLDAIAALSHSALALDFLSFIARRLPDLQRPTKIPFTLLKEQFGQEYQGKDALKDFRKEFLQAVQQVKTIYPAAQVEKITGGLLLKKSFPIVRKTQIQGVTLPPPPEKPRKSAQNLTERTISLFRTRWPRLDVYACQADFDEWLEGKEKPKNYQAAFIGFSKKWGIGQG